jgi:hypothetical protein
MLLMCAHDRCVEDHEHVVGIARQNLQNPHENATFAPSSVPSVNSFQMPVAVGQIAPWDARAIAIDDRSDEQAIVGRRTAHTASRPGRKSLILSHRPSLHGIAVHAIGNPRIDDFVLQRFGFFACRDGTTQLD